MNTEQQIDWRKLNREERGKLILERETIFHMIKSKFRGDIKSKKQTAQFNELLIKVLCHNVCVVIQEINELGVKAEFKIEETLER